MSKPVFIAIEGVDGSGKSTQSAMLAAKMRAHNRQVHQTFEPTNYLIGKVLRSVLRKEVEVDQRAIAALFLADRLDHITKQGDGLLNLLHNGNDIVCDRYYFSSYAYHSVFVDMDWVISCNAMCAEALRPDLTIFIDVPVDECMRRISAGRETQDLYETADMLTKVRSNYLTAIDKLGSDKEKVVIIDGNQDMDIVAQNVWQAVTSVLESRK